MGSRYNQVQQANKLLPEHHIVPGNYIWWNGLGLAITKEEIEWSCAAVITEVDYERKTFRITSLDDMGPQYEDFPCVAKMNSSEHRLSMRAATEEMAFGCIRESMQAMDEQIAAARKALVEIEQIKNEYQAGFDSIARRAYSTDEQRQAA